MRQMDAASGVYRADALLALTDDTGLIQHSKYSLPDPQHGYSADDNARALLAIARPGRGQATRAAERRLAAGDAVREEALARLVRQLTEQLLAAWEAERDGDWQWFEPQLTYSNALVPWALLLASRLPEEVRRMRKEGGGVQATAWADLADDAACTSPRKRAERPCAPLISSRRIPCATASSFPSAVRDGGRKARRRAHSTTSSPSRPMR